MGLRPAGLDNAEGDIARAAGDIEMPEGTAPGRAQHRNQRILPEAVQPGAHDVVHQIVARGDLVEDIVHPGLLLAQWDILEPEMRGFRHCHRLKRCQAGLLRLRPVFVPPFP